jgi:hypothetical protein
VATVQFIGCLLLADSRRRQLDVSHSRIGRRLHARGRRHGFQQARHLVGELTSDGDHRTGPDSCTRTGSASAANHDGDHADNDNDTDTDDNNDNDNDDTHAAGCGDGWVQWRFRVW